MGFQSQLVLIFSLQIHTPVLASWQLFFPQDTLSFKLNNGQYKSITHSTGNFDFFI